VVEEARSLGGPDFSPDSRRFAVGHEDGSIRLYELPSDHQRKFLDGIPSPHWLSFNPNGRQLAVSCATGIQVYDLEMGRILADFREPAQMNDLVWHPDGRTLAAGGDDSRIYLWDIALGRQTHVI
jgi:WD40 repeat protein